MAFNNATVSSFVAAGTFPIASNASFVTTGNTVVGSALNISSNATITNGSYSSLAQVIGIGFVGVLLMAVTVVGNFLVIASYRVNRRLRTINNMFLVSLAFSDLIIGLVSMTLYPIYMISRTWYLGPVLCDIWLCLDYTLSMASVANLLLICLDRYFSITRPFTYRAKRTRRRTRIFIISAWVLSMLLWSPAIIIWPRVRGRKVPDDQCLIQFFEDRTITLVTAILAFYLPVLVMSVLYALIYRETTKCSQYLEYLKSYRRARSSSLASPFLSFRRHTGGRSLNSGQSPRLNTSSTSFPQSSHRSSRTTELKKDNHRRLNSSTSTSSTKINPRSQNDHRHYSGADGKLPLSATGSQNDVAGNVFIDDKTEQNTCRKKTHRALGQVHFNMRSIFGVRTAKEDSDANHQANSAERQRDLLVPNTVDNNRSSRLLCPVPSDASAASRRSPVESKRPPAMPASERKAGRTLSAILLAFIITWLPYNVCVVYKSFCMKEGGCIPIEVWDAAYYLCYINSTINPFCFALCNKTFRQTFLQLLSCRSSRSSAVKDFNTTQIRSKRTIPAQPSSSTSKSA